MQIRDGESGQEESLNMTPLIDMVFLLLIFFLVATTFRQEEREQAIQLPGAAASQPLSAPPQQMIVNIKDDGTMVVAGEACAPDELAEMLANVATNEPQREVLIRADERSLHRFFAGVARICRDAGIAEVKIGYVIEEPRPMPIQ